MLESDPVSVGAIGPDLVPSALALRIARRLRRATDWNDEIDEMLGALGAGLRLHRAALFRWRDLPEQGFAQTVAGIWVDDIFRPDAMRPSVIAQTQVFDHPELEKLTTDMRRGQIFSGHTHQLEGFLKEYFEHQRIRSFLSVPIFSNGHLWGDLAVNDCAGEREWSVDEKAAVEIVAWAIGDAIDRSTSEQHVSEVYRATVLQAALDGVVVIDEAGAIIEFNPAAERMFGWAKRDILGKSIHQTIVPHDHRDSCSGGMNTYLREGSYPIMLGRRTESHAVGADGMTFPVELTISEVSVGDRRLFVASIRDMREQRRAEEEINRQRDRLHQNEKMAAMGSLLAGVSHELNNPLAVVVAQSTLLHEFASDPATKARAEKVRAAAERCGRIVKSFLGMVRLHPTDQAETDLNRVLRSALEVTAYGARSSGIAIATDFAAGSLMVLADADHITQVAANFLVNGHHAVAVSPGDKRIKVATFRSGESVGFSVEDNGPGVPVENRERIFEPYFTTKPVGVGTGIGLSISRSIVERHNGRIWYEAVEPHGARFVVELPALAGDRRAGVSAVSSPAHLSRALIVDDEPDVASSLADMLELMGVTSLVLNAWPPEPGQMEGFAPDIVFSDLRMPGASGMAIFRELSRERPRFADRFVLVTGDMIGARAELEPLPAHRRPLLLEKPFSTLDVRNVLAAVDDLVASDPKARESDG